MFLLKRFKRVMAAVMAAMLCLSVAVPCIAADLNSTMGSLVALTEGKVNWETTDTEGQITIKVRTGSGVGVFTAYKLLDVYNDSGVLKVSIPTETQAFWNGYTEKSTASIGDIKVKLNAVGDAATQSSSIIDYALNHTDQLPTGTSSVDDGSGNAKITTTFGFYLIKQTGAPVGSYIASAPVVACLPMQDTDNTTWLNKYTVEPKDDTISITKRVKATGDSEYKSETITNIGDTVTYEVEAKLPTYGADIMNDAAFKYEIKDTLPTALTLGSVTSIQIYDDSTSAYIAAGDNVASAISGNTITVTVSKDKYNTVINGKYSKIKIEYTAVLNKDAVIESTGNNNTATLTYSSAVGTTGSNTASAKVYTMGLDITKIDKDSSAALSGAVFTVHKTSAATDDAIKFVDITGSEPIKKYRVATPADIADTGVTKVTEIAVTSSEDTNKGKVTIVGLDNTTYYFKEITAPSGYTLPTGTFTMTVEPTTADYTGGDTSKPLAFDENYLAKEIQNTTTIDLPTTGGIGTIIFTAGGVLLMAGAFFFLFGTKKKKNN